MTLVVAAYGGGTNSTAMIIDSIKRGKKIDLILFADTGGERPETYRFVELFSKWIKDRIGIGIEIVRDKRTLEDDCLIRKALPSIVYGFKSCSLRFKAAPQKRYIKQFTKNEVLNLIGYDAGEPYRAKPYPNKIYPLIERGITRDMCINIIKAEGLPLPGKSSCFFCPNSKPHEILSLPRELQDRAIAMERNAKLTVMKGLGRTWKWEDLIMADRAQESFNFKFCDVQLPCECYD